MRVRLARLRNEDASHTLGPDGLVESCVNPHILGAHLLLSKLLDLLDSPGSLVLEANAMQPLVHVDGVLPRHHLSHGGSLLLLTRHFASLVEVNQAIKAW